MNFGQALDILKVGGKVSREVWNGKRLWLELEIPDANEITLNTTGAKVPWLASHTDILADDWGVVD